MNTGSECKSCIDNIEEAYEFMLAYAAQGRSEEGAGPDGSHIRLFLKRFVDATESLLVEINKLENDDAQIGEKFYSSFKHDCGFVISVVELLLNNENISSDMIDNTNGLINMRSYLTNIFFLDKVILKS